MKQALFTDKAPAAIGTYSQAIQTGDLVFISGQIPLTVDGEVKKDIIEQIHQVLDNLQAICKNAGGDLNSVIKFNVSMIDLTHFTKVNEIMESRLSKPYPARAVVQVAALPKGVDIEIEAIAQIN